MNISPRFSMALERQLPIGTKHCVIQATAPPQKEPTFYTTYNQKYPDKKLNISHNKQTGTTRIKIFVTGDEQEQLRTLKRRSNVKACLRYENELADRFFRENGLSTTS